MTKARILALLSVMALLPSLPIAALAQGGDAPPIPPFQVVGRATIDGEPAMDGTIVIALINGEKVGHGIVMDGKFSVDVTGEMGAMIMFYFQVGEGDEAIQYMATTDRDVTVGLPGVPKIVNLMAYSGGPPVPIPDECVDEIGTPSGTATRSGVWADDCESIVSGRGYARYYIFSLTQYGVATIDLESGDANTYLYLREGETTFGTALYENDDHQGSTRASQIQETLAAGTYTVEATTNSVGATGPFTLTITVEYLPTVNVSRAAGSEDALVRLNSPIPLTATFSRPVFGFTVDDITVIHGTAVNFAGSDGDSSFTFDVAPNALGEVTVDIADAVATDGAGAGNTEAPQLSLGIPYDFDGSGGIGRNETIAAIVDYFAGKITRAQTIAVIVLYFSVPTEPATGTPEGDRAALVALHNATGKPNWERNNNWLSEMPIGEWSGVTTDDNGRVTGLHLYDNELGGEIPPELGSLADLEFLSLGGNQLSGEIPPELGNFANLESLDLGENHLSGEIPPELANLVSLSTLSLSLNQLSGEIPPELGNIVSLSMLSLGRNQLSGEIPPELGNIANLTTLTLYHNQLSGEIPPELGNIANLAWLYLYDNELSGEIPPELDNLANLEWLLLGGNQLSGEIPPELGNLVNLVSLNFGGNQLSGEIPPELGNLANMRDLGLHGNQLSGEIPPELDNLANLEFLSLGGNQLSGEIPPGLDNLANLKELYLSGNQLSGEIPPELGNLANLESLYLDSNQLSGEIPPELGNLANLKFLLLGSNQLSGEIPPELGSLANLTRLSLSGNQLIGCVPNSLSGRLVYSDLGGLQFCP